MKKIFAVCFLVICCSAIIFSCSKDSDENNTTQDSDKFVGTYLCITGDSLIITKTDSKTINLDFRHGTGWHVWDHTFVATVSGNILTVSQQYWNIVSSQVSATGKLSGSVLTIDYYYHDDGFTEDGLIYNKLP